MIRYVMFAIVVASLTLVACDRESTPPTPTASAPVALPAGTKPYPLTTCIVSGEDLHAMGEPVSLVHEGQEFKFCCDSCVGDFKKEPAKFVAKLPKE